MKTYVGKEPCPQCGSKDNVGVWSDGQKWCFSSCGYFVPGHSGLSIESIREHFSRADYNNNKKGKNAVATLPNDFGLILRGDALAWLDKYGITDGERFKHKIGWSNVYESLVLPAFDLHGNLLLSQRRYFGDGPFEKYHTKGTPESVVWTVSPSGASLDTLVLVEDFVSAVKVGRQFEASPLWGSSLSDRKLVMIADRWTNLILWLDADKLKAAMEFRLKALPYFKMVHVVFTDKDPKEYDDRSIAAFLIDA